MSASKSYRRLASAFSGKEAQEVVEIGDRAPDFELYDCDGDHFKLSDFRGRRVMLSFFRYASCPICLYNIDRLKEQSRFLEKAGIITVSIFPSTPAAIRKHARTEKIQDNVVLSDEKATVYKNFQVKKKTKALFVGVAEIIGNMKRYKKYIHDEDRKAETKGNIGRAKLLPADFLIDEEGIVVDLFRAKNPTDHMSIERVEAFIPKDKRCNCNRKECLFPSCRREYEIIRNESEKMFTY